MSDVKETASEQLMQAVAGGDLSAFDEIVLRHQKLAWGIAYRFLGDRHAAEDIAQEAFLKILDAAPRYRPTASFRTYLSRVVTRLCLDYAQRRRPTYTDDLPPVTDSGADGARQAAAAESEQAIQGALMTLPPNQRMAVVLRYFEGLSLAEIAEAIGISGKAAERLLARARESLEPLLAHLREE
jgi:RNA polymerase sigma-70 factor (ECF subfamily)